MATVVAAYALDAVATTAGVLLAASALLGGADYATVLVFLAATYVVWGAGMRVNLAANWTLLEETGTSTNVLSKAAHDTAVEPDELETIRFFAGAVEEASPGEPALFFGVGPTLHHVFLAAPHVSEIHLGDYLPENLREVQRWIDRDPEAHDWRAFVRYTLECEGVRSPTDDQIGMREELTRARITRLVEVDARQPPPAGDHYATVVSASCADSATADRDTWATYMRHIAAYVLPGGLFLTSALRRSEGYRVGERWFPSANVDEHDMRAVIAAEFERATVETRELAEHESQGYAGIVLASARRAAG